MIGSNPAPGWIWLAVDPVWAASWLADVDLVCCFEAGRKWGRGRLLGSIGNVNKHFSLYYISVQIDIYTAQTYILSTDDLIWITLINVAACCRRFLFLVVVLEFCSSCQFVSYDVISCTSWFVIMNIYPFLNSCNIPPPTHERQSVALWVGCWRPTVCSLRRFLKRKRQTRQTVNDLPSVLALNHNVRLTDVVIIDPNMYFLFDPPASCQFTSDWRMRWAPPAGRSLDRTVRPGREPFVSTINRTDTVCPRVS